MFSRGLYWPLITPFSYNVLVSRKKPFFPILGAGPSATFPGPQSLCHLALEGFPLYKCPLSGLEGLGAWSRPWNGPGQIFGWKLWGAGTV